MRKIKCGIIFIMMFILASCSNISADEEAVIRLQIGNPNMTVNGETVKIDNSGDVKPEILGGRTLVPIRAIIEAVGGSAQWDDSSKTTTLSLKGDTIKLTIGSDTGYINSEAQKLDSVPTIINERTMLPIRFIAEGFNFGVAWESESQTVVIIKDTFTNAEYDNLQKCITDYSGNPYSEVNNNYPMFKDYEITSGSYEYYSTLDDLGRCNVCSSSVAQDLMPTEKRGNISSVKPTGWVNHKYDNVSGGYLYNRCHLIGFQLTGENANKRNLITGTRYLNVDGMLPYENMVAEYVKRTGNHVMYRVTPVFSGDNLLADGVLMEAYSVEDGGVGITFCVYCYNVQPNININYQTGDNLVA